jgi:MocE subfamily Rieske [2Fe-2S] domain protein
MGNITEAVYNSADRFDYSLTGLNSTLAVERGLAEADWYQCAVPRDVLRSLLERRDGPAIRDTILWFALIFGSAYAAFALWHTIWFVLPYFIYCALYATTSDSRWHETSHGTAFKTGWMNNLLYEIASFMVMREATIWRWSHNRHHSDTIVVGRDPEIAVPRPPNFKKILMTFFGIAGYPKYFKQIVLHSLGRISAEERTFIPDSEFSKIYIRARIYLGIYAAVLSLAILTRSVLPLLFVGFPNLFGTWLMVVYGMTQHAGLAENVLDHRLNCRTVYMNVVNRYLYWNMNYHVEHHMFPLVPYHALHRLHLAIKDDCPAPYASLVAAWSEIIPALLKQAKDPAYTVKRQLPEPKVRTNMLPVIVCGEPDSEGWVSVCDAAQLGHAEVLRFDHGQKTFALYRDEEDNPYATDGVCTHGNTHLSEGLIVGNTIECAKHNGRFNLIDGSPARAPICRGLATYPVELRDKRIYVNILRAGGAGARAQKACKFRVASNRCVATFIKELVLEPLDSSETLNFIPGDYIQLDIPQYDFIRFSEFDIPEPFAMAWKNQHLFDLVARNPIAGRRNNYSMASNPLAEPALRFNVRIATPPPGQDCAPGIGSSYVFSLKPGDIVSAIGPFGDFHIKPTQREMIYIGGGAGMAPLRAHLAHLLENEQTARKISFWYGARSRQEVYYEDYFQNLANAHRNFTFHLALSSPQPDDNWPGHVGFIHEVVLDQCLRQHPRPESAEYYLCGPPPMIKACTGMLEALEVPTHQIAYDEF